MSSTYNPSATFVDIQSLEVDDPGQFNQLPNTPYDSNIHLSPYNSQNLSTSASPSYNTPGDSNIHLSPYNSHNLSTSASPSYNTPGDSGYSNYQPSEFSDIEDPFFGVNFDDDVQLVDSLPLALAGTATYQALLNRRSTDPAVRKALVNPAYLPLSPPLHSSNPNTPPLNHNIINLKGQTTISQHELTTELHNSRVQSVSSLAPLHSAVVQLTPEQSGGSHTSTEEIQPSTMTRHSPPILVSEWGNHGPSHVFDTEYNDTKDFGNGLPHASIVRDEDGEWSPDQRTGQAGLDPYSRRDLEEAEVPTLKEQEMLRQIEHKNVEVEEWSQELPSQSYFPSNNEFDLQQLRENNDITPLNDDEISVHENRFQDGQTYFDFNNPRINEADKKTMMQSRHWNDAPSYPFMTNTGEQYTASEAMERFRRKAESISGASRAATWGTRRRSEPSLADWEGVSNGSFLKKLSLSRSSGRTRKDSLFDQGLQGLDRLANIVPNIVRRSDAKIKRARSSANIPEEAQALSNPRQNSQGSLALPSRSLSYGKRQQTPSIGTTVAAMASPLAAVGATSTHTRHGSISTNVTSPKNPGHLGFANRVMNRARSKSDLAAANDRTKTGIAHLWRANGGPPVANLASPQPQPEILSVKRPEARQIYMDDDDGDEEDEQGDEGEINVDIEIDPIIPNFTGFKAHVKRLNPEMDAKYGWLIDRIAHEQEIRYKNLLDLRVKHSQAILNRKCSAGSCCLSLGGSVMLTDTRGNPRDSDRKTPGLQLVTDFSDNDSNPREGALTDDTFPTGVPMPPTRNLPAEFECQLCFKVKKFQKPSDWTKHVHEDVQPFTCTYEKCKEPKSFKRKADWVRHENERHRHLEWWICDVDDCRHPCYRKDNFLQHLVREHKLPEPKAKTKAAIKKTRTTDPAWIRLEKCHNETENRPQDEPCKFCAKSFLTWKKLTVHLAKHMEHISLPILRLVEIKNVDANTIISPVEQILTPITPSDRAKMESHSPFNMDSVSPHMPTTNQFSTNGYNAPQYFQNHVTSGTYGMQVQIPQGVQYGQEVYPNSYVSRRMEQPRAFGSLDSSSMGHIEQSRNFEPLNNGYTQPEQTRNFGSLDSGYQHQMPISDFHLQQTTGFTMPQIYSTAPAIPNFHIPNVLGINDTGFGFDPMAANGGQSYQNTPMSRAQDIGSSSYEHSPQNVPFYGS